MPKYSPTRTILMLCSLGVSSACGAAPSSDNEQQIPFEFEAAPPDSRGEVIHEFEREGVEYAFVAVPGTDEHPALILTEQSPIGLGQTPYERLMSEYPELSLLEAYSVLNPNGEAPSELLLDDHQRLVSERSRSDGAVRIVQLPAAPLVEKSAASCEDSVEVYLEGVWAPGGITHSSSSTTSGSGAALWERAHPTTSGLAMAVALCNDSSGAIEYQWGTHQGAQSDILPLSAGSILKVRWGQTSYAKNLIVLGFGPAANGTFYGAGTYAYIPTPG